MRSTARRRCNILLLLFAFNLLLNVYLPTGARSVETRTEKEEIAASQQSGNKKVDQTNEEVGQQGDNITQKVGEAGEKVGKQIDTFSKQAASLVGSWINATVFAGISWLKLILCFLLLFVVLLVERIARLAIVRKKTRIAEVQEGTTIKYLIMDAIAKPLSLFIWVYGIYIVLTPIVVHFQKVDGSNLVHLVAQKAANLGAAVALVWFIFKLVSILDVQLKKWAAASDSTVDELLAPLVGKTLRVFIVIIGGILIIQNLTGVKIGPLLASLGIGGIAIALAAKDSIANFFGTLTILFDKPFQVGDRVLIDSYDGVVESVGFRSTRIRTLTGHLVTIPNEKIVNSGLENISRRPHIRWLTNITITYDTAPDKVEKAVSIVNEILDNHEGMLADFPPRVFFNGFNDWSLNITAMAWYHPPDYWKMQDWLQRTCLQILRRFNDEGIDFAFPSSTVYLAGDAQRKLELKLLKGEIDTIVPQGSV